MQYLKDSISNKFNSTITFGRDTITPATLFVVCYHGELGSEGGASGE